MPTLFWVASGALALIALVTHVWVLWRSAYLRMHLGSFLGATGVAAALVVPVTFLERELHTWAGLDPAKGAEDVGLLLYAVLVEAPIEMALVTFAVWPFWRLRRLRMRAGLSRSLEIREGVFFALSASLGFALVREAIYLAVYAENWLSLVRAAAWTACFCFLCVAWGYVLGRYASRGMRSRRFSSAWVMATVMSAVVNLLVFRLGEAALIGVGPLLFGMSAAAFIVWRDDQRRHQRTSAGGALSSIIMSAPAPSLDAIREAFAREDRPLTLRWVGFGAFVTTGMITSGLVAAIWLGHSIGIDFSVVDRPDAGRAAMAPLAVLGSGALAAFPGSGYLLARASGTRSVLEPALAASLAMVLTMVFMGMLAPVSVVFAVAFAPVGFALTCIGAWFGMGS